MRVHGKVMSAVVSVVLAVGLMPAPAVAADACDLAAGAYAASAQSSIAVKAQASKKAKLAKATKKMRSCYKKVLSQARNGKGKFKSAYSASSYMKKYWSAVYSMYDVNKDGTPELFVQAGSYDANTVWYAFTVKNGKAKYLGTCGGGQTTLGSGKGGKLYGTYIHMNAYTVSLIKMSSGKVKVTEKYAGNTTPAGLRAAEAYSKSKGIKSLGRLAASNLSTLNSAKVTK